MNISIVCPKCKKNGNIEIPSNLFKKTLYTIKITVYKGVCCEHNFLVFTNSKGEIKGYENIDFTIQKTILDTNKSNYSISDLINIFNINSAAHILHALLFSYPILLSYNEKSEVANCANLMELFRTFFPSEWTKRIDIDIIDNASNESTDPKKYLILYSKFGIIQNTPWDPISLTNELKILQQTKEILDEQQQYVIIQAKFQEFWNIAHYFAEKLNERKEIYEEDIKTAISSQFKIKFVSDYDLAFYSNLVNSLQLGDTKKIKKLKKISKFFENF